VPEKQTRQYKAEIRALTGSRLFINTGLRMVYPFLPAFARGLGVPLATLAAVVSLRGFTSLLSPLFGPLSDRYGRRLMLVMAMILFCLGCAIVLIWPTLWAFGLTLAIIAVAKVIYDPAMQAYLGDTVAYEKRGRALAITELSWAGAFLLGVPFMGFIMERQGWQATYAWLGAFGLAAAFVLWRTLPTGDGRGSTASSLGTAGTIIRNNPVIWASAVYVFLVMGANELLLIVYGGVMEIGFGLSLTALGLATAVIGGAEVTGEILTALYVDRLGKRPFVIVTGIITCLMYLAIPFTSITLTAALISLFVLFLFFEMSVVGGIPLMTEVVPSARGVVMSVVLATGGLGRGLGALLGPQIMSHGSYELLGLVASVVMALAVLILVLWIREAERKAI
jgi:predicted MFS family arabinose efflux permease